MAVVLEAVSAVPGRDFGSVSLALSSWCDSEEASGSRMACTERVLPLIASFETGG